MGGLTNDTFFLFFACYKDSVGKNTAAFGIGVVHILYNALERGGVSNLLYALYKGGGCFC